jgi:3-oxoacyl-[acyl-carrier protein] reductase
MRLKDKVALVTGSTFGVGRAIARMFAAEGAAVIVTGRTQEAGEEVVRSIEEAGGSAIFVRTDVGEEDEVKLAIEAGVKKFGRLTTLVNNAAPVQLAFGEDGIDGSLTDLDTGHWNDMIRLTLSSVFWSCKYAIPAMIEGGGGSIVNISTVASIRGTRGSDGYTAAKAGLNGITRSVAAQYAEHGIRSNGLIVGMVLTGRPAQEAALTDPRWKVAMKSVTLTRLGQPEDVGYAALFLASDESAFITGTLIPVDGGMLSWIPIPEWPL